MQFVESSTDDAMLRKVTVVVPAYNAETFIERTIRSALDQTYPHLEILVVNDGSTDGTASICHRLSDAYENLTVTTVENGGVASARNIGTEMANSYYVAYLDADDLWHPTKIEKQVASLEKHRNCGEWAGCYALYRLIDADDQVLLDGPQHTVRGNMFGEHILHNHVFNGSSLLVKRDVALAVGGFDTSYAALGMGGCEDYDFQLKLMKSYKMELVREYVVGYRTHPAGMSKNCFAMGQANIAVIDRFLHDSAMSNELRNSAQLLAHSRACQQFAKAKAWQRLMQSLVVMLRIDPYATVIELFDRVKRVSIKHLLRVVYYRAPSLQRHREPSTRPFPTYGPLENLTGADERTECACSSDLRPPTGRNSDSE